MTITQQTINLNLSFVLHWYGILMVLGVLIFATTAWYLPRREAAYNGRNYLGLLLLLTWTTILGGKLGNMLFYGSSYTTSVSDFIFSRGGLSFHGSFFAVTLVVFIWAKTTKRTYFCLADRLAIATPSLLVCGRLGNFINKEIYGVTTNLPWGVQVFPGEELLRHPVQLYEMFGYFLLYLALLFLVRRKPNLLASGLYLALFLLGYCLVRIPAEFFKAQAYSVAGVNTGIWLSLPLLAAGVIILLKIIIARSVKE